MKRLSPAYIAAILTLAVLTAYLINNAGPGDYKNLFFLYSTLAIVAVSFYIGSSAKSEIQPVITSESRPKILALLIFIFGAALRFYALDFGLPHNYHPDEVPKVNAVMRMYTAGSLDPNYFLHPSLLLYSTYFSNYLFHLFGVEGGFQDTAFLAGRVVSALAGSLSVFLVYLISKEVFSNKAALLSALMLAVFPLHVTSSRYLKEDSLLVFFVLLSLYFTLISIRKDSLKILCLAGFAAGLSASTKYSGALTFAVVAAAPWLKSGALMPDRRFFVGLIYAGIFFALGFFAATPYSLLNMERFIKDVSYESRHMSQGHTSSVSGWSQYWMYHLTRSIIPGASLAAVIFSLFKSGLILKRKDTKELYILFLICLFYFSAEYIKSKPAPQPERYILPCIPFVAILAGGLLDDVLRVSKWRINTIFFVLICFFLPLKRSIVLASEIKNDTRVILNTWIEKNLPAGSKIMTDRKSYAPLLDEKKYAVRHLNGSSIMQDLDIKRLRKSEFDYLILSSLFFGRYFTEPNNEPIMRQRIRELSKYFKVIKQVRPKYGTYGFHNPTLIVYSLKERP